MRATTIVSALVVIASFTGYGTAALTDPAHSPSSPRSSDDFVLLARWMTGSFSRAEQAAADPDGYRYIRLASTGHYTPRGHFSITTIQKATCL